MGYEENNVLRYNDFACRIIRAESPSPRPQWSQARSLECWPQNQPGKYD